MTRIEPESLASFTRALAQSYGADEHVADDLASSLVEADLVGHSSHGTRLMAAKYDPEIAEDKIDPPATAECIHESGVFSIFDGHRAFGQHVAREVIDAGTAAASSNGVGVAALRNVSHIGRVGEWAERAAEAGMALVGFVANPGSQWVAPPGSADRRFSTNPVIIGIPTYDALSFPLVLDIATSQVARSKIREPKATEPGLPDGWVIDENGEYVNDASAFEAGTGAMLPLGGLVTGHKGFGLAALGELLAGIISTGSVSGMPDGLWGNHAVFFLIDLEQVTTQAAVEQRVTAFREYLDATDFSSAIPMPWATKGERALLPGEAEAQTRSANRRDGIPMPPDDAQMLRELATERGVTVPDALH